MPQIDEPTSAAPKAAPETRKSKPVTPEKPPAGTYAFTVDTAKGRIVGIEKVDGGAREAVSPAELAQLAKAHGATPLRHLVERAFEAGIACVLGEEAEAETSESKQDSELSGVLLQTLIEGSKAKELLKSDTLDRTFIGALFSQAAKQPSPTEH